MTSGDWNITSNQIKWSHETSDQVFWMNGSVIKEQMDLSPMSSCLHYWNTILCFYLLFIKFLRFFIFYYTYSCRIFGIAKEYIKLLVIVSCIMTLNPDPKPNFTKAPSLPNDIICQSGIYFYSETLCTE